MTKNKSNLRNVIAMAVCLAGMTLLSGCGGSNDPLAIAEKFANAYCNVDYDVCNSLLEDEEFTPSGEMSEMEKAAMKLMRGEARKMQYVVTPDNEDNLMDEDHVETSFVVTSCNDTEFKDRLFVDLDRDEDTGKWKVSHYHGM